MTLQKNLDEAIRHFPHALRIKPDYAEAHNKLGGALGRQGKLDEAVSHFSEALRLKPGYAEAQNNLEHALQMIGTSQGKANTLVEP